MPKLRLLADVEQLTLCFILCFIGNVTSPRAVLVLAPHGEHAHADDVVGQPDDVFGGGLEEPVGSVLDLPGEADACRPGPGPEEAHVRIERLALDAEGFG